MVLANQLLLKEGDHPGLPGWVQRNHKGPKSGTGRQKRRQSFREV
jgi:hypothetical protein